MKNYILKIAGYRIGFEASAGGPDLAVSQKFLRNISFDSNYDVLIKVHSGQYFLPREAERVFHAPFVEVSNGILIHNNPDFWSIWKFDTWLFIKTIFPLGGYPKNAVLKFSLKEKEWDLWMESDKPETDPFEYPLDGLILYYLTVINNDIMIHASGINYGGEGYMFSGVSGKGKSTMARIWADHNASVIHDDRLIIRKAGYGFMMYNTPVYNTDEPLHSQLSRIFIIEHGTENKLKRLRGAAAISHVMANCIQHTWGHAIVSGLLGSVSEMCAAIPVYSLHFLPENSVIDHILNIHE